MAVFTHIPGWFDFSDLYREVVSSLGDGATVVETGVYLGKSTAFLAEAIRDAGKSVRFHAYDTFEGVPPEHWKGDPPADWFTFDQQEALRVDGTLEQAARQNLAPLSAFVQIEKADGVAAAAKHADGSVDFVFLDDDHGTGHLLNELLAWWPKIKPGGAIAGHDFDWQSVSDAVRKFAMRTGRPAREISARSFMIEKPVRESSWLVPVESRKCLVAVCCNERNVPRHTAESLVRIGWGNRLEAGAAKHGFPSPDFTWTSRYVSVADLRDEAVMIALKGEYSHMLFLDADMVWPSDVVEKMLAHHARGIVSGLYHLKAWPHWPVALRNKVWNVVDQGFDYTYDEHATAVDGALRPESLVGLGCTLVPVEVFRRYERPWFKYQIDGEGLSTVSEDVYFCQQAEAMGCPIYLDPSVQCGHVSQQPVTSAWYDRATYEMLMLSNGQRMGKRAEEPEAVPA